MPPDGIFLELSNGTGCTNRLIKCTRKNFPNRPTEEVIQVQRLNLAFILLMIYLCIATKFVYAQAHLVPEPRLTTQVAWEIMPNGHVSIGYDTNRNGIADFFTMRVVLRSYFSKARPSDIHQWYPGKLIFFANYNSSKYYYIAQEKPILYAIDLDEDGIWDLIYRDEKEDSVNGNEQFYSSPSGMFNSKIAKLE